MTDLTPEERVRRVKAALAEAGYPSANVEWEPVLEVVIAPGMFGTVPPATWWRAKAIAKEASRCWPCFSEHPCMPSHLVDPCTHDPLTSPWPEVVR